MIDHDTLVRRVNDVMDDILQGEYGPHNVDEVSARISNADYSDTNIDIYEISITLTDVLSTKPVAVATSLSEAMALQASVRLIINQWLDNDIVRKNQ